MPTRTKPKKAAPRKVKRVAKAKPATARETVLVMRTCAFDMTSHGGFVWPQSGPVECKDWRPIAECGNGLHGLLWGDGDATLLDWSESAKWLVVEAEADFVVSLGGKVKFPRGVVLYCGDMKGSAKLIGERAPAGTKIVGGTATAGTRGTATAGTRGTATAGTRGTATAGDEGTATAGYAGTATAGDEGTATAGYAGTATAGDEGTATAGDEGTATAGTRGTATAGTRGTATAGDEGTATAGDEGTATAGDAGTATAGYAGTATAGYAGTATAGDEGSISIFFYDSTGNYRRLMGFVGKGGLEPNVAYVVSDGKFVRKDSP